MQEMEGMSDGIASESEAELEDRGDSSGQVFMSFLLHCNLVDAARFRIHTFFLFN